MYNHKKTLGSVLIDDTTMNTAVSATITANLNLPKMTLATICVPMANLSACVNEYQNNAVSKRVIKRNRFVKWFHPSSTPMSCQLACTIRVRKSLVFNYWIIDLSQHDCIIHQWPCSPKNSHPRVGKLWFRSVNNCQLLSNICSLIRESSESHSVPGCILPHYRW